MDSLPAEPQNKPIKYESKVIYGFWLVMCQYRHILGKKKKIYHSVDIVVDNAGKYLCVGTGYIWKISVNFSQFCKAKTSCKL